MHVLTRTSQHLDLVHDALYIEPVISDDISSMSIEQSIKISRAFQHGGHTSPRAAPRARATASPRHRRVKYI